MKQTQAQQVQQEIDRARNDMARIETEKNQVGCVRVRVRMRCGCLCVCVRVCVFVCACWMKQQVPQEVDRARNGMARIETR